MGAVAEARAEAARLWTDERLDVPEIAQRMGRSVEGAELLLKFAGVDLTAPRPMPAPVVVADTPVGAPAAAPAPVMDEPRAPSARPSPARDQFHATMLRMANAEGVVEGFLGELATAANLKRAHAGNLMADMRARDLLETLDVGTRLQPPKFRVFATPTPLADRPPMTVRTRPAEHRVEAGHARLADRKSADRPRRKPTVITDAGRFVQVKPITPEVVRWAREQVERGAELEFVAWCFDRDADALGRALEAA